MLSLLILIISLAEVILTSFPSIITLASIISPEEFIQLGNFSLICFNSGYFTLVVLMEKSDFIKVFNIYAFLIFQNSFYVGYFSSISGLAIKSGLNLAIQAIIVSFISKLPFLLDL